MPLVGGSGCVHPGIFQSLGEVAEKTGKTLRIICVRHAYSKGWELSGVVGRTP
ncbi:MULTISPECIES: hypothetical protein [unclassified Streptomyces]|uniref:hypothetical protein n=1 Tax=unclassified Streptomyces TaxID=2593676 RepID=UPI0029AD843F|nr:MULTISPECIES: hypothetical protein [unclassified Streptomyces]MDX3772283.1 hypothetical protein [Streptomyces sp. AK08-01B]MDX3821797.1 hypothetical protein [Streptomyces sp. AK08-01A]